MVFPLKNGGGTPAGELKRKLRKYSIERRRSNNRIVSVARGFSTTARVIEMEQQKKNLLWMNTQTGPRIHESTITKLTLRGRRQKRTGSKYPKI